jgi:hypothetical protein
MRTGSAPLLLAASTPAPPPDCVELVHNGGFEESATGWTLGGGAAPPAYATELTFNDSRQSLRLGVTDGPNVASISLADQELALPKEATSIVLSFRYYPLYDAPPGPGDLQYVDLYNATTGQFAGRALGVQINDRTWRAADYDLTALGGQTVSLVFAVNNDGVEGRTALYVDNVSVMACHFREIVSPGPELESTATPTPALSQAVATPTVTTLELPAVGQPLDTQTDGTRTWLTRLGVVGVLLGVLGAIGFVALIVIGTMRARE